MVYFTLYSGIVFSKFISNGKTYAKYFALFWIAALIVFSGTREWIGCDFSGYLNRFKFYSVVDFEFASKYDREVGFLALNYLVKYLNLDYMWLNVFAASIFFYCTYKFVSRREDSLALIALFFPILVVQLSMSGLRQALAVAILLLAWNAFVDGKRMWTALFVLAASTFHVSSIIFLPLAFLAGRTVSTVRMGLAVALAAPVVIYLLGERAEVYQSRYIEDENESLGAIFRVGLTLITAVGFQLYRRTYAELYPRDYELMRTFSLFSFGVVAVFFVSSLAAHRLNYYIMPVQLLMLSRLPHAMSPRQRNILLELAPFAVYAAYMVVWYSYSRHARLCYQPYDSYLF